MEELSQALSNLSLQDTNERICKPIHNIHKKQSLQELRNIAKTLGVPGVSNLKRNELIQCIQVFQKKQSSVKPLVKPLVKPSEKSLVEPLVKSLVEPSEKSLVENITKSTTKPTTTSTTTPKLQRTRNLTKMNEQKDIDLIIKMLNDSSNEFGKKLREEFHKIFQKDILEARRSEGGGRRTHFDFQIRTEDGWFNVEHKGTQIYRIINPEEPPWKGGVQFYNGGLEKYHFAKKYAHEWYSVYYTSGILKEKYSIKADIPSFEKWFNYDAKIQGDPQTPFGIELKSKYRKMYPGKSLTKERDDFVSYFLPKCTPEDCETLKEDILPILQETLSQKHFWLQIAGNLNTGKFNCAWNKQLFVSEIKNIVIVKKSDIWIHVECDNDFHFRGILRFGKGIGFSNLRLDLRD
jgi:hypothetical protein